MILNWNYGMEMGLQLASKTFTGIESSQSLQMPLTAIPLFILLRTSAGGAGVRTRLESEWDTYLRLGCSGGTMAQPATLECTVLGVKR